MLAKNRPVRVIEVLGILIVFGIINGSFAHVSLTFPPARQFPLDFLNTFWTKQPCGMPRGNIKTTLVAGSFNATWHLGYAHQGGYRIELLDSNENRLMDLTPTRDNDFYQGRTTAQWHYIEIPENVTCRNCVIRLLRQVPEFAPNFQFISCADVDIVSKYNYKEDCSGHGYAISGRSCTCYSRYWGDRCQYQDECDTDLDCNGVGRCTFLGGSALPRKQCYCPQDYFGITCNRQNPPGIPTKDNLDLKRHVRVKLDERMVLYFKVLLGSSQSQDQIEFVLRINGTSYGGLGWRPSALGPICKSWPFYQDALIVNNHNRRSKRSSTFTITKSIDHSDNFGQGQRGTSGAGVVETFSIGSQQQQPQPQSYDNTHVISNNQNQGIPSRQRQNQPVEIIEIAQPQSRLKVQRPKPTKLQELRPQTQPTPQPPPPQQSPVSDGGLNFTPSEWAAKDAFTPMDCSDIVVGSARGFHHRIRDSYSRGRHTPLPDAQWGGRDDLLGANGWEQNGVTTLVFRRRMDSSDGPDHPIRGDSLVIWARGQQPGESVQSSHQLERGNPTVSHFYTAKELKYHGLGSQRGFLYIDFTAVRKEFESGAYSI